MSVTVVVPTKNSARTLAACLASIRAQSNSVLELIVVDNDSTDGTAAIARAYADRVETRGPERSAQRNYGARIGSGELVAFIDSDMVLEPGLIAEASAAFAESETLGALIVDEVAVGKGWLLPCRRLEKDLARGDPTVEAARIFRREAFHRVGGFAEHLVACEDWDLADRVTADGWRTGRVKIVVRHDEGRITLRHCFTKKLYYGRAASMWISESVAPARWARPGRLLVRIARSDVALPTRLALLVLKLVEWAGFAVGVADQRIRRWI
jgi:glycosyltransferase involved in cell wall biosynthesis